MNTHTSQSRRNWLKTVSAITAIHLLHIERARAQEPSTALTALQAAAAVASVIGFVTGREFQRRMDEGLANINAKLDLILQNQERILEEIQSLRFYIDKAVYQGFRESAIVAMQSHEYRLKILMAAPVRGANKANYDRLLQDMLQTAGVLGQYDPVAFIPFTVGVCMCLSVSQLLNYDQSQIKKIKEVFRARYSDWLNPANAKGIVSLIATTGDEIQKRQSALQPYSVVLSDEPGLDEDNNPCQIRTTLTITGSFSAGYTGSTREEYYQCYRYDFPRGAPSIMKESIAAADASLRKYRDPIFKQHVLRIQQNTPIFQPSGIAQVDAMNRERIAIYKLMDVYAKQQAIRDQIQACGDALKT